MQSLKRIENYPLYEIIIDHEVEDVAEIFTRLNMAGVKVRESDVIIALIAAKQEGWVREEFNPFLKNLEGKGFEIDPAILIRSLAVIGKGIARLKDIPENFWEKSEDFEDGWSKTKNSIAYAIRQMNEVGVLSSDILPSHNALIPMFALHSKFSESFNFKKALYWFLLATGDGRYSGSAITALDEDTKVINSSQSFNDAVNTLVNALRLPNAFTKNDFLKDYDNDFLRLVYYLMVFKNGAKDWICQDTIIGYDRSDNQLNEGFKPEWHHFFPRAILRKHGIQNTETNAFANIVVLNEKANRQFKSNPPEKYIEKNNVKDERLQEQLIPTDKEDWRIDKYSEFLYKRADSLAREATNFLDELKMGK